MTHKNIKLDNVNKVYIIGIEGAGTSALARILGILGKEVSGSDEGDHFYYSVLESEGIKVNHVFSPDNISEDTDLFIYGSSFKPETNEELKKAFDSGKPVFTYAEALSELFNSKYGISVCGTHGKSTTSALLSFAMNYAGADPSAIVGAKIPQLGGNSLVGKSEYFILESDEYQNKLDLYDPKAAILTSCDWDHPDFFPSFSEYKEVFKRFVAKIPKTGFLVTWVDSTDTLEISKSAICDVLTYGFSDECDYRIIRKEIPPLPLGEDVSQNFSGNFRLTGEGTGYKSQSFEVTYKDESLGSFEIQLVGKHNILNATAVIAACHKLQLDMDKVREALKNFKGTSRRFELIGEHNGAILIDDYGHHPEEIKTTLNGAKEIYPDKTIWAVFHPHTYTRTKALLHEFSQSFDSADKVIVLDIYGSAREQQGGVHSTELVELINKYDRGKAEYIPTIDEAVEFLKDKIDSDDVVIAIGAGNVWEIASKLKEK